jgi:hypothetical protein
MLWDWEMDDCATSRIKLLICTVSYWVNYLMQLMVRQDLRSVCVAASVVQWSEFLATDPEVPVSIPGATTFSEKLWV